ncbi:DUF1564 domain-containing protein [Leptospira stimsonii]|uniref:DUF1564 domain-containing protein n=1 Tax=Leptospira stimsonii TaxID=2202203 RepID=A0ABY2N1Z1_9LEPT|nr:DUF1564 domain-containing protein [Leptospira stimsonii]TGK20671.1 DUF1564 domain-containing protein [Leptospira stimsonii]TGM14460.1 DUF1564 domain-containing protein [Leptospira stimsonii]
MKALFLNSDFEIHSSFNENSADVVTLLVPKKYLQRLSIKDRKKLPKRLPELLKKYSKYIASSKRLNRKAGKTLYQANVGRGRMKRINARIRTRDWILLGTLAQGHGVSRCYLFNYLLWIDEVGVGNSISNVFNSGSPTFHKYYKFILLLDLSKNRIIKRLEFEPNPIFTFPRT